VLEIVAVRERFDAIGRIGAAAICAGLLAMVLAGFGLGGARPPTTYVGAKGDPYLYEHIIERVRSGQSYYGAAVGEQRLESYPLRPFLAVRPPALAVVLAALPSASADRIALEVLCGVTFMAWIWRLRSLMDRPVGFAIMACMTAASALTALGAQSYTLHEIWCGELIALSLAVHGRERWLPSVLIGVAAVTVRELAAAYLVLMLVMALRDGRQGEARGWALGLLVFAMGLLAHAYVLSTLVRATDLGSPGWFGLGGWRYVLAAISWNPTLILAPHWLVIVAVPFTLLGVAALAGPLGDRVALTIFAYLLAFAIVGRPDNAYWGLMLGPLWPLGLVYLPSTLKHMGRSMFAASSARN